MFSASAPSQFTVAILPLGNVTSRQIELTCEVLEENFGVKTLVLAQQEIPFMYLNIKTGRYKVDQLSTFAFLHLPTNAQRIISIVEGPLAYAEDKLCAGYGDMNLRTALYSSSYLYKPSVNGLDDWPYTDLASRHLVVHEFGHTLGLAHCANLDCAMNKTEYKMTLCAKCRRWADYELKVQLGSAEERFSLGESWFRHGELHQAIALYREAIRVAPRPEALYRHCLGAALHLLKKSEEANSEMVLAIAYSNDSVGFYYNFGVRSLRDNLKLAEEYFAKAVATAQNPQKVHRLIGQAYREICHDVERASRHYQEYLQLGGDDQEVVEWLESRGKLCQA